VQVEYDPALTTYQDLLNVFWGSVDPTDEGGQFFDRGPQYQTAIFVQGAEERAAAEASKAAVEKLLGRPIATTIRDAGIFYPAEEYHQNLNQKDPEHYNAYVKGSGRKEALKKIWG
jgi:peptide-methionine (S)-S-oxide reductase